MRGLVLAFVLLAPAAAQSLSPFGSGCGARGAVLAGYGAPVPGGILELQIDAAAPHAPHVLAIGFSNTQWGGASLPLAIPPGLGFASGCAIRTSHDILVSLAVGGDGVGRRTIVIPAGLAAGSVHFQAFGLPSSEPAYATRGVEAAIAPAAPAPVSGTVALRAGGAPVENARVTLFAPGLSSFFETRSDASGSFSFAAVPPGTYRAGAAALGLEYAEGDLAVPTAGGSRTFLLEPQAHPGRWDIVGNTLPHLLDATDIAVLLPDGRIFYCHDSEDPIVFDPVTGAKSEPAGSGTEQGCTNTTLLEDGRVIEIGGQAGPDFRNATQWVKAWSPAGGWARLADLLHPTGRWYPGLARLADGDLLVMGGGTRPSAARTNTCEIFAQNSGTWRWTGSMGQAVEFPPCGLLFTGEVLRTWGTPELYDPASGAWRAAGSFVAPARGWPGHSDHSLVILSNGRALAIGIGTSAGLGAAMVESYDPAGGTWTAKSSPSLKRMQAEIVCLPDGQILVAGGDVQERTTTEPQSYGIVKRTDLYDPRADRWRRVADMLQFREYHAVTILVPDGRVLTTGGTKIKFQNVPLSADIEAYSAPYLFRGVRPQIGNLSTATPARGATVAFDVFPATRLTHAVLIGTGAHTHWVDAGVPRRLELAVAQTGTRATVALPSARDVLPVGHYLLFGMVDDVPSVGRIVRVRL